MRMAIIGVPDGHYVRDLLQAAARYANARSGRKPIEAIVCTFESLSAEMVDLDRWIVRAGAVVLNDMDFVIVRTMPLGSLEQIVLRMDVLHLLQRQGVCVVNSPRALEIAIDKWLALYTLRELGVSMPRTVSCQTRADAMVAFELLGGDIVVKPIFGGEGRGIVRITDPDIAWRVFSTLEQMRQVAYIQAFIPHHGYDLRLLVIGDEVLAVRRQSMDDWRTNVSRGAVAIPHEPTDTQRRIALQAARSVDGFAIGVDLIPGKDGKDYLIEINAVPGWKGTGAALGVDVADRFIEQLVRTKG